MECPLARFIDLRFHVHRGTRVHVDCMFDRVPLACANIEDGPHAVQVHGVSHHGFVNKLEADPLTVFEANRIGIFVLDAIDAPGIPLHIAGQTKLNFAGWLAEFIQRILSLQVSV